MSIFKTIFFYIFTFFEKKIYRPIRKFQSLLTGLCLRCTLVQYDLHVNEVKPSVEKVGKGKYKCASESRVVCFPRFLSYIMSLRMHSWGELVWKLMACDHLLEWQWSRKFQFRFLTQKASGHSTCRKANTMNVANKRLPESLCTAVYEGREREASPFLRNSSSPNPAQRGSWGGLCFALFIVFLISCYSCSP